MSLDATTHDNHYVPIWYQKGFLGVRGRSRVWPLQAISMGTGVTRRKISAGIGSHRGWIIFDSPCVRRHDQAIPASRWSPL